MSSKIEWTDRTWNPLAGCTMVSRACENCYAMRMAFRLEQMGQEKYKGTTRKTEGGKILWTGKINFDEEDLLAPLKWKKPQRVFVNSMSDLFHENVPFEFVDKVFAVMALTPHITYQILTKRPERMAEYFSVGSQNILKRWVDVAQIELKLPYSKCLWLWTDGSVPLPNVWLGTTIENQAEADKRIPHLLNCPAAVRFVSCEPLLGPISFRWAKWVNYKVLKELTLSDGTQVKGHDQYDGFDGIHWVIAGGESGPKARPSHPDWFRSLRDQCQAAGVPFFFKQWGEWHQNPHMQSGRVNLPGTYLADNGHKCGFKSLQNPNLKYVTLFKVGKKAAGNLLDGQVWEQFPVVGGNEGEK